MLFHFLTGEKVRIYRIFNESDLYVIGYIFLKFLLLPILLQKKNNWEAFVYLSLVYDNNSTAKSIRKVLMSVMIRHNESKRDNSSLKVK